MSYQGDSHAGGADDCSDHEDSCRGNSGGVCDLGDCDDHP